MTQREVAGDRYTRAYIGRIEAGLARPSPTALEFLAEQLGTSVDFLLTGIAAEERERLRLAIARGEGLLAQRRHQDAVEAFREALTARVIGEGPEESRQAQVGLAEALCGSGAPGEAIAVLEEDRGWENSRNPALVARGRYLLGWSYAGLHDLAHAAELLEDAARRVEDLDGEGRLLVRILSALASASEERGDLVRAERVLARACAVADEIGDTEARARALWSASLVAERRGDIGLAYDHAQRALELFGEVGWPEQSARLRGHLADLMLRQERAGDALKVIEGAQGELRDQGSDEDHFQFELMRAAALDQTSDGDGAAAAADRAAEIAGRGFVPNGEARVALWRAHMAAKSGDHAEAVRLGEEALGRLPEDAVVLRGEALARTARSLRATGRHEEAAARFDEHLDLLDGGPSAAPARVAV